MVNLSAFNSSTDVTFVIKNNSSINRSIKVFNTRIGPGNQLDLMSIPGITEEDIRSSLISAPLKNLFDGGALVVVKSTVNFSTLDNVHNAFLKKIGLSGSAVNAANLVEPNWFIDPVSGSDKNVGTSSSTALATCAELYRRLGSGNVLAPVGSGLGSPVYVTITIMNNVPSTDPLNLDVKLGPDVNLLVVGDTPAETALVATVVRSKNRGTNTPWALTTVSASSSVGARIKDVTQSSAGSPAYFFGIKNEGSNVLRISEPLQFPGIGGQDDDTNRVTPLNTDTFVIQTLKQLTCGAINITATGTLTGDLSAVYFQDLQFVNGDPSVMMPPNAGLYIYGCIGQGLELANSLFNGIFNCCINIDGGPITWSVGGFNQFLGGALMSVAGHGFIVDINCTMRIDMDCIFQGLAGGATVLTGNRWLFGTVGIFDSSAGGPGGQNPTGDGIRITPGATAVCYADQDITNTVWGAGNAGAGIGIASGSSFEYNNYAAGTPVMTITGSTPGTNDFTLAGSTSTYAPAVTGTPTGPTTNSWANLANASDFPQGTAFNPLYNAWIIPFH